MNLSLFLKKATSLLIVILTVLSCTEEPLPVAVTNVTLNTSSLSLCEGDTHTLIATVSPSNADNKTVIWSSSNSSVASVQGGVVTAVKAGTATVIVKTEDGGKIAECLVEVTEKVYSVTGVSLDNKSIAITEGDEITLIATINPQNATNKNVTWSSSNTEVAVVDNGKVTALKPGQADITVTTEDGGKTATCEVKVSEKVYPVTSVSLDKTSVEMTEGDEITLTATVNPSNATNRNVTWSSSNTEVAVVKDGKVTALKPGLTTIEVLTEDGDKKASCKVVVNERYVPVTSVSLDQTSIEMVEGDAITLTATVNPENATNKKLIWSSTDEQVAIVTNREQLMALSPGHATITVTTEDGGMTATCEVTVKAKVYPVESVKLNMDKANMLIGDEMTLEVQFNPANATNQNVVWSSSDPSVVSVENGIVKALTLGSATITVTTEDGGKTASCVVSVVNIDSLIKASFNSMNIGSGSMSFVGSYVKLTTGVKMGVALNNYSSKSVTLTGFSMICGATNAEVTYTISEAEVPANTRIGYTVTLVATMYSPIAKFTYRYGSETYTATVQYNGSF